MSLHDNGKVLASQEYHCPVTGLPIKKRPVRVVWPSSTRSQLQDFEISGCKPSLTCLRSSASNCGSQTLAMTTHAISISFREPKVDPKEEPIDDTGSDRDQFRLHSASNSSDESTLKAKPAFQSLMASSKVLSPSKCYTKLQLGFSHDDTLSQSRSFLGLSSSGHNSEGSSLKQGNTYYHSSILPSDCGNDSGRQDDQTPVYANRLNMDLNIPVDAQDNYSSLTVGKHSDNKQLETGGLQNKTESYPSSELARTSTGRRGAMLGNCTLQKCVYDFGLGNLSSASNCPTEYQQSKFEVSLDLQLKPPCKPETRFNWPYFGPAKEDSDAKRISLGLSLLGSCIEPELCDSVILKNKDVEFDQWNLSSPLRVKSEPCQGDGSSKTTEPSNLPSDCSGLTKSVSSYDQAQGHPKGIGEVSSPKAADSDWKMARIMEVQRCSHGSKFKKLYDDFETSRGIKVKGFYDNFEIDLNIPLPDWDDSSQATTSSNKRLKLNETLAELVVQGHHESHLDELLERSSLLKEMDGIAANSSILISEPMEIEHIEPDTAKDVKESDGSGSVVYQGNKPDFPDAVSDGHSKMVTLNCNGSVSSMVSSDDVPMDINGKSYGADKDEPEEAVEDEPEEAFEGEPGEEFEREPGEAFEDEPGEASGEESEEFEEDVEVCCDDESDGSHQADGDANVDAEEFEEVVEEVAHDDDLDGSHHGEDAYYIEPESDSSCGEYGDEEVGGQREGSASVSVTVPTIPSQENTREKQTENTKECVEKRESEATMMENLQPSAHDASTATKKRPLKTKHVWETKSCLEKDISETTEEGNTKPGWGTWGARSGLNKDIAEATAEGNTKHGWESWENIAEAIEEGSTKQGRGSWGSIAEATEEGNMKHGWGFLDNIAVATDEGSTKHGRGTWETKSGPKDIDEATGRGSYELSRRQNTHRFHSSTHGDATKHERPWIKGGRIIKLRKSWSERSSFKGKPNHDRETPSHFERDGRDRLPGKSFRREKPHLRVHRDNVHKKRFHKAEINRNEPNQFGMRRSDYTWVRKEDDASHCDQKFPTTKTADEGADVALSSQRHTREGETHPGGLMNRTVRSVRPSPSGGYSRKDILDIQTAVANEWRFVRRDFPGSSMEHPQAEGPQKWRSDLSDIQNIGPDRRVVRRDFPGSGVDHPQQYTQQEGHQKRRINSNVIQNIGTDPRSSSHSSWIPFGHPSRPWLRDPQTSAREEMQFSHERAHYPNDPIAPGLKATTDDVREIAPQYTVPITCLPGNIRLRRFDVHPRQIQEESFRRSRHYYEGDQTADTGSSDERHWSVGEFNGHPRPPAYRDIKSRLGNRLNDETTVDAEFLDETIYQVENDYRHARYGQELHEDFRERASAREHRGNVRDRLGRRQPK